MLHLVVHLVVHHASAVCHVGDDKELIVVNSAVADVMVKLDRSVGMLICRVLEVSSDVRLLEVKSAKVWRADSTVVLRL